MWVQIPPAASKVVKGSSQNLDKGETIYPHPPLMTDAPENTITFGNSILSLSVDWFRIAVRGNFPAVGDENETGRYGKNQHRFKPRITRRGRGGDADQPTVSRRRVVRRDESWC